MNLRQIVRAILTQNSEVKDPQVESLSRRELIQVAAVLAGTLPITLISERAQALIGARMWKRRNQIAKGIWGAGTGYIGNGFTSNQSSPVQMASDSTAWSSISGSDLTGTWVKSDNTLWVNSGGGYKYVVGELQNSVEVGIANPVKLTNTNDVIDLALSRHVATNSPNVQLFMVRSDNSLWAWGKGTDGLLGLGSTTDYSSPVQISGLWSKVFTGRERTYAIKTNGTLWGWGLNNSYQLGINSPNLSSPVQLGTDTWSFISGENYHTTFGIKTNGTLWRWGRVYESGDFPNLVQWTPWQISGSYLAAAVCWVDWSPGTNFSFAINSTSKLLATGRNDNNGQLGLGDNLTRNSFAQVGSLNWIHAAADSHRAYAIRSDGTLWGIGSGYSSSPVQVGSASNWTFVTSVNSRRFGLRSDGTLWAWGYNWSGGLGLGHSTDVTTPVQIGTDTNWVQVVSTGFNTAARKSDGTIWGWGNNSEFHVGSNYPQTYLSSPVQIGSTSDWAEIGPSGMGIKTNGTLWVWGSYQNYLGSGVVSSGPPNQKYSSPIQVGAETTWWKISRGPQYTLALKTNGTMWASGNNYDGEMGLSSTISSVSTFIQVGSVTTWSKIYAGSNYAFGIRADNSLWVWGSGFDGQLGNGASAYISTPVQVGTFTDWQKFFGGDVGYGTNNCNFMGLRGNGTIWGWGNNYDGALGDGTNTSRSSPTQLNSSTDWTDLVLNVSRAMAIKSNGTLWAWGNNTSSALGLMNTVNRSSPTQVGSATDWSKVLFPYQGYALKTSGTLWGWGSNSFNSIKYQEGNISSPVQAGTDNWTLIAPSFGTMWGGVKSGNVYLWGNSYYGYWPSLAFSSPVQLGTATNWLKVEADRMDFNTWHDQAIGLRVDGTIWNWGFDSYGNMGDGALKGHNIPLQMGTDTNWGDVALGVRNQYAIKTNGTLWSWGENASGQLGIGSTTGVSTPVQIGTLSTWSKVRGSKYGSSSHFAAAIKTDGTLWMWGKNESGQLGLGDVSSYSSPMQIGSLTDWADVSLGSAHVLALKTNGTLWSWGLNANGQLGLEDITMRSSPTQIGSLTDWTVIKAGNDFCAALRLDGTAWSWGSNSGHQLGLGLGNAQHRSSPCQIGSLKGWTKIWTGYRRLYLAGS